MLRETDALKLELRIRRLLDEVKPARAVIAAQRKELKDADAELQVEKENSASLQKSNTFLKSEVEHGLKAISNLTGALEAEMKASGILKSQVVQLKGKVRFLRKVIVIVGGAAVAVTVGAVMLK